MGEVLLSAVTEQLLGEVEKQYSKTGSLTDEALTSLQFVFQGILLPSLDLVDKGQISSITSPSGRSLYQVIGSSGTPYICFASSCYCSCPAYRFSVLLKEDHLMCKHMLAIELSRRMDKTSLLTVSDREIADIITNMVAGDRLE